MLNFTSVPHVGTLPVVCIPQKNYILYKYIFLLICSFPVAYLLACPDVFAYSRLGLWNHLHVYCLSHCASSAETNCKIKMRRVCLITRLLPCVYLLLFLKVSISYNGDIFR